MPTYFNTTTIPISLLNTEFPQLGQVETYDIFDIVTPMQVSLIGSQVETFNITTSNNIFIFKFNLMTNWVVVPLAVGAARTAAQIVYEINQAYEAATADGTLVAFVDSGHIKLLAPIYNNFQSQIYIKLTHNTALAVL